MPWEHPFTSPSQWSRPSVGNWLSSGADAVRSSSLFRRLRYHCAVPRPGYDCAVTRSPGERRQAVSVLSLASCWDGYGQTGTTGNDGPFVAHSWAANGRTRENRCPLCGTLWGPSHTICIRQTLCEFLQIQLSCILEYSSRHRIGIVRTRTCNGGARDHNEAF